MKLSKFKFSLIALFGLPIFLGWPLGDAGALPKNTAVMQGLDKVTARVSTFQVPLDEPVRFGSFTIRVRHCDRTPPEEQPEATAFVEVDADRDGEEPAAIFTGWMFASSPALNAVEHPVYDVWLLDCIDGVVQSDGEADTGAVAQ